jgi:sigma-E factor negative regulatory protein RseC
MIETRVRVLSSKDGNTLVEATEQNGCGACATRSSCGISGLGKYFDRNRRPIAIACGEVRPGAEMLVGIDESDLLKVGLFVYLIPTLLVVISAAIADAHGLGDAATALAAIVGGGAGLLLARLVAPTPRMQTRTIPITPTQGDLS